MKSFDLIAEVKRMEGLAEEAEARAEATGALKDFQDVDYFKGLAEKLRDLAWHYDCLENEGILK